LSRLDVLISGAGIAGCTLAFWLARYGHSVTVVERGSALRSSGAPVDVRGPAALVADQMNLTPKLLGARTHVSSITLLDQDGRQAARIDIESIRSSIAPKDIEVPRGDLATILHDACRTTAEFVFGESITSLVQNGAGVDVEFRRSRPRRFDLVIGADGLHSIVRRLAFGPEQEFVHYAGLYVATLPLPQALHSGPEMMMLNAPGRCVAIHPCRDSPLALFIFWHPELGTFDHFDVSQHKRILETAFGDLAWKVPAILDAVRTTDELYFDTVSKVAVPNWARDRVALLGDASSCVSLFGDGSTLAIAGAHTLATALAENPSDHQAAFRHYQLRHNKLVKPRQKNVSTVASVLVPKTNLGISLRNNVLLKLLSGYAALMRVSRRRRASEV
jgi:2-polyprenyl-6-methoxyphenol hydroxylase-like FAD-dependent oxidoreductase